MNRSRRDIPTEIKICGLQLHETKVLEKDNITFTILQGRRTNNLFIVSTIDPKVTVNLCTKRKPETVLFYDENKFDADIVDQMASVYSVKPAA